MDYQNDDRIQELESDKGGGGEIIGLDDKDYIIKLEDEIERLKQERDEAGRTAVNWHREFKKLESEVEALRSLLISIRESLDEWIRRCNDSGEWVAVPEEDFYALRAALRLEEEK